MPQPQLRRLPVATTEILSVSQLTKSERQMYEDIVSPYGNPAQVLERKIKHLARLLNCSEEEATHQLLHCL